MENEIVNGMLQGEVEDELTKLKAGLKYSMEYPEQADIIYAQYQSLTDHFIQVAGLNTDETWNLYYLSVKAKDYIGGMYYYVNVRRRNFQSMFGKRTS